MADEHRRADLRLAANQFVSVFELFLVVARYESEDIRVQSDISEKAL
jgi:hypothetical protein